MTFAGSKGTGSFSQRCLPLFFFTAILFLAPTTQAFPVPDPQGEWARLYNELAEMGLPSRFLRLLPVEFVKLEFADLKNVAAEYHPDDHRMVFHLSLSVGRQGTQLLPLREVSNKDLATMYHELFHAYFDYVDFAYGTSKMSAQAVRLYQEAKRFAACRYTLVEISPSLPQKGALRKAKTETRRISERESWEALNETWGVFVGWALWNLLESTDRLDPARTWDWEAVETFLDRLEEGYQSRELAGYFEPTNPNERRQIPRWYLAPSHAISLPEIALLLKVILEQSPAMARLAVQWLEDSTHHSSAPALGTC